MTEVLGIPLATATPLSLALASIALIITSFARGWILSKFAVLELLKSRDLAITAANQRAQDYRDLYEIERARGEVLAQLVADLKVVGVTAAKILDALPALQIRDGG